MDEIAKFDPPRLPWRDEIEDRFGDLGVTKATWKALVEAVFPSARRIDSVIMALSYCKARNLDPFKRPVHIVPMWDSKRQENIETVWPSIAEARTTAFRTAEYAGCAPAEFGPQKTKTFTGSIKVKGKWEDAKMRVTFPEWCCVTVWRMCAGKPCSFTGPKVYWLETYGKVGGSDIPNSMWARRQRGQLEKCAEVGALRKAFPEELGSWTTAEEMEGQTTIEDIPAMTPRDTLKPPSVEAAMEGVNRNIDRMAKGEEPITDPPIEGEAVEVLADNFQQFEDVCTALANELRILTETDGWELDEVNACWAEHEKQMEDWSVDQKEDARKIFRAATE